MTTRFLTIDELIYISEQIPTVNTIHRILKGKDRVRDMALLETAWGRPMQTIFGHDAYPTIEEKAAALLHSLVRNHPFVDGNKRVATVAAVFMLAVNGRRVTWDPAEALEHILDLAEGRRDAASFAAWLPTEPCPPALEPDAPRDMALIESILQEHAWLLDQLAAR